MVDGKLPATGKVGAEVTPEEAKELAAHVRAQRARRGQVRRRRPRPGRPRREGRRLRRLRARTSPASPAWSTAPASCSARCSATPGVHARSAVGVAVLPLDAPVEVEIVVEVARLTSIGPTRGREPSGRHRARPGGRASRATTARVDRRRRPATRPTVVLLRDGAGRASRSFLHAPDADDGVRRRHARLPRRRGRPARRRRCRSAGRGPRAAGRRALASDEPARALLVRRRPRDVRGVRRAARRADRRTPVVRHQRRRLGGATGWRWTRAELALRRVPGPPRLVLRADLLRPWARWITPEFEPSAATTPGSSSPRCRAGQAPAGRRRRGGPVGVAAARPTRWRGDDRGELADAAADDRDAAVARRRTTGRRGARRWPGRRAPAPARILDGAVAWPCRRPHGASSCGDRTRQPPAQPRRGWLAAAGAGAVTGAGPRRGHGAVVGRDGHRPRDLRAGAEPGADDARRHQHLDALGEPGAARRASSSTPGRTTRPPATRSWPRLRRRPGRADPAHPRAPRPRRGRRARSPS